MYTVIYLDDGVAGVKADLKGYCKDIFMAEPVLAVGLFALLKDLEDDTIYACHFHDGWTIKRLIEED